MKKLKNTLSMVAWLPFIALKIALAILGLIFVPLGLMLDWPRLFWLWGNDEEGCPDWWKRRAKKENIVARTFPCWWWYAIRNPVGNLRFLFEEPSRYHEITNWAAPGFVPTADDLKMEARQMQDRGQRMAFRFRRAGWKSGYRRVWLNGNDRYSEFWIGWKLGSRVPGLGFALQLRLKRPVGD